MVGKKQSLKAKKIKKFREEMPWPFNTLVRRQFNLEARDRQKRKK